MYICYKERTLNIIKIERNNQHQSKQHNHSFKPPLMITNFTQRTQLSISSTKTYSNPQQATNQHQARQIPNSLNTQPDFIKRFHLKPPSNLNNQDKQFIALYENQFKVRIGTVNQGSKRYDNDGHNHEGVEDISKAQLVEEPKEAKLSAIHKDLCFQTVPYDAHFLSSSPYHNDPSLNVIVSNKSMPVRIYQLHSQPSPHPNTPLTYCSFHQHKPNSQAFLPPYEFSIQNKKVIGVGRKFMSVYDCEKIMSLRVKAFDKVHLSTVELLSDQNTALIGDFVGSVYQIDLRQDNKTLSQPVKPHLDAVFHLKSFSTNSNLFISSARKDNFTYLFDRRNLSTFLSYFQFQRHSNQRYGLTTKDDIFAVGLQDGSIYVNSIESELGNSQKNGVVFEDLSSVNVADLDMQKIGNGEMRVFYAVGTRFYQSIEQEESQDNQGKAIEKRQNQNFGLRYFTYGSTEA